ncbi:hypothetical protein CEB3_c13760 [Peptococcaceae bacterium CEB3]|nr:hypothetical protein CEB3_c13760 [Peptococcaceae bacterium CEB3]
MSPGASCAGAQFMGRENWLPVGHQVADYGGYYVNVFNGIDDEDWSTLDIAIEDLKQTVVQAMADIFPGFSRAKKYRHGGVVILENDLAQVVIAENDGSMAVYLVIPDTEEFPYPELGRKHLKRYLAALQTILLKYYPGQVRVRRGPWTSGILRVAM